jgi:hypothetical protein
MWTPDPLAGRRRFPLPMSLIHHYRSMSMKKAIEVFGAALLLATATVASARTPAQKFADEFSVLQAESSGAPAYHPAPTFSNRAEDPTKGLTERAMQALSNGDPAWQPKPAGAPMKPTFAQMNPHGLPFAYYQAVASNSDAFKLPPNSGAPAYATSESAFATSDAPKPDASAG